MYQIGPLGPQFLFNAEGLAAAGVLTLPRDVLVGIARAEVAAHCRDAINIVEMCAIEYGVDGQRQNLDETAVPHAQAQLLIEDANALRHAGQYGLQVGLWASGLVGSGRLGRRIQFSVFRVFGAIWQ